MPKHHEFRFFENMPVELTNHMASFLPIKDAANLSRTASTMLWLKEEYVDTIAVQKLLTHVVRGEEEQALKMIKANPRLLLIPSEAIDYSGRTIKGTAFQAALGAEDHIMAQKILEGFGEEGKAIALEQLNAQYPEGIDAAVANNLETAYDFTDLINVIISGDEDACNNALEQFRSDMTTPKEITTGMHFNMQHLINAYEAYTNNFDRLANWENRNLFWVKVIGFIQRQMTANYAQYYCTGLYGVVEENMPPMRDLKLYDGRPFYSALLGVDFAIYVELGDAPVARCGGYCFQRGTAAVQDLRGQSRGLTNLCETKTSRLTELREQLGRCGTYQPK